MARTNNRAIIKSILYDIATQFHAGKHQRTISDLPVELQLQLDCTHGRALSYANDIRIGKIKGEPTP